MRNLHRLASILLCLVVALASLDAAAWAQCPTSGWQHRFATPGVLMGSARGVVHAMVVWDPDGIGPQDPVLVLGGDFDSAGGIGCSNIATWDGSTFRPIGVGLGPGVRALAVHEGMLYAGGAFTTNGSGSTPLNRFAVWENGQWRKPGTGTGTGVTGGEIRAMASVPAVPPFVSTLVLGGTFDTIIRNDGSTESTFFKLAVFDGANTHRANQAGPDDLGSAVTSIQQATIDGVVGAMVGVDRRSQSSSKEAFQFIWRDLPLGGFLGRDIPFAPRGYCTALDYNNTTGVVTAFGGPSWREASGTISNLTRMAQADHDDDGAWQDLAWPVPSNQVTQANAILRWQVSDIHTNLYAGGDFTNGGGILWRSGVTGTWATMADGFEPFAVVHALALYKGQVYAGGYFQSTVNGLRVNGIARWNGTEWRTLGEGAAYSSSNPPMVSSTVYNGEPIAAGQFDYIGGRFRRNIARWNGDIWMPLGTGLVANTIGPNELVEYEGDLIAVGVQDYNAASAPYHNRVLRWSPSSVPSWSQLGNGFDQPVLCAAVRSHQLFIGGLFTTHNGTPCSRVAYWNDSTWVNASTGASWTSVYDLKMFGGELYAAGVATRGGAPRASVARWNGSAWVYLGNDMGTFAVVQALAVHEGNLYAAGNFDTGSLKSVIRWNGTSWVQVGTPGRFGGCDYGVTSLASYNGDLIAGGLFYTTCGARSNRIMRYDGVDWEPLAPNIGTPAATVTALNAHHGDLWIQGQFRSVDGAAASGMIVWRDQAVWASVEPTGPLVVNVGQSITLNGFSSGNGILAWRKDGVAIPGANTSTLNLSNIQLADAGSYTMTIDESCHPPAISNDVTLIVQGTTSASDAAPIRAAFSAGTPNPGRGVISHTLTLPAPAEVAVEVLDLQGRVIATLHRGPLEAGVHTIRWDDRRSAAPGIYFVRAAWPGFETTRRVVRMR